MIDFMVPKKDHIRAFIAIPLPDTVKDYLADLQKDLKRNQILASWPKPISMHLTLKFLGDIKIAQIPVIKSCMIDALDMLNGPVSLSAKGIGVFPSVKNARVIWCGAKGQTDLVGSMVGQLEKRLHKRANIRIEKKRFLPHLTIARPKQRIHPGRMVTLIQKFADRQSDEFLTSRIQLFKSELKSSGAVHTQIFSAAIDDC